MLHSIIKNIPKWLCQKKMAIIVGSSPLANNIKTYKLNQFYKIAVNNAWRLRKDFDYLVYPDDFPHENIPKNGNDFCGTFISNPDYMTSIDKAGGILYCGATMSYAAGYWAVDNINSKLIGYYSSDMMYNQKNGITHFYGVGTPDPLRQDVSLSSLEARSIRLFSWALEHDKLLVNFSESEKSRLQLPKISLDRAYHFLSPPPKNIDIQHLWHEFLSESQKIKQVEQDVSFDPLDREYWTIIKTSDQKRHMDRLDKLWLSNLENLHIGYKRYLEILDK